MFFLLQVSNRCVAEPSAFPDFHEGGVGMYLGGKFIVCGGFSSDKIYRKCWGYDLEKNRWRATGSRLSVVRIFPYGVLYDDNTWWITGGSMGGGNGLTDSSDFYYVRVRFTIDQLICYLNNCIKFFLKANGTVAPGPNLPEPMNDHCLTKIDDTRFFLAGAKLDGNSFSNKAYIFDKTTGAWTQVANMAIGRNGLSCSKITDSNGDLAVMITVGYKDGWIPVSDTEIFSLTTMTWSSGPSYPIAMAYGVTTFGSNGEYYLAGGIGVCFFM